MTWRYQPVVHIETLGCIQSACVTLIEVHLNEDESLNSWADEFAASAIGDDPDGLCDDLVHMLLDAMCWQPVLAAELKPGLKFRRTVDQETREKLADFIDGGGEFLRTRRSAQASTQKGE